MKMYYNKRRYANPTLNCAPTVIVSLEQFLATDVLTYADKNVLIRIV